MGVTLTGLSYIYCDNMFVINNNQRPESTLKNKNINFFHYAMQESIAMGESLTAHIPTISNLGNMSTNTLLGYKKRGMAEEVLYDVFIDLFIPFVAISTQKSLEQA